MYLICLQACNTHSSGLCVVDFILKVIIPVLSVTLNKTVISKFWLDVFGEMVGMGGALVANLFWILKGHWSFQFVIKWAFFEVSTTTNDHFKISIRCILGKQDVWGLLFNLRSLWILIRALKLLIANPMNRPQSLYDHPFYAYLICPKGITYNSCPKNRVGLSSSKT